MQIKGFLLYTYLGLICFLLCLHVDMATSRRVHSTVGLKAHVHQEEPESSFNLQDDRVSNLDRCVWGTRRLLASRCQGPFHRGLTYCLQSPLLASTCTLCLLNVVFESSTRLHEVMIWAQGQFHSFIFTYHTKHSHHSLK